MKIETLVIAFSYLFICLFNDFKIRVIVTFIVALSYKLYCGKERIIYRCALVLLLLISLPLKIDYFTTGRIDMIKDNYYTVSNGLYKVIVYSNEDVNYGSKVTINSNVKKITTYNNFQITDFSSYCKGNNIIGYVDDITKIDKPKLSILTSWYKHNEELGNDWANRLIFSRGLDNESDNIYLITQSGMHISFLFVVLKKILCRYMYKKQSLKICVVLSFCYGLLFGFPFGILRVFVSLVVECLYIDKRKRLAMEIIILCLLKPYYVLSLPFLAVIGIKTINTFSNKRSKIMNMNYMLILQLIFYHQSSLIQVIFFSITRQVSSILFIMALLVHFPMNLNQFVLSYVNLVDNLPKIKIIGRVNILFLILLVKFMLDWLKTGYKKYLIYQWLIIMMIGNYGYLRCYDTVTFLDVGQGDCCLITLANNPSGILIDTAGNIYKDVSKDITIPYLESMNIDKVNVIITHDDYDHSGGLSSLIDNFSVDKIYREKQELIKIDSLEIFNPLYKKEYDNENDNSIVSYLRLKQFSFLFLADVSSAAEKDIVNDYANLDVDVVKLSHHGSKSATSDKLLAKYKFKYAIISSGRNNKYGHPNEEVIERLNNYHIKILSTKENNAVKFYVFNHILFYVTSDYHWGFLFK